MIRTSYSYWLQLPTIFGVVHLINCDWLFGALPWRKTGPSVSYKNVLTLFLGFRLRIQPGQIRARLWPPCDIKNAHQLKPARRRTHARVWKRAAVKLETSSQLLKGNVWNVFVLINTFWEIHFEGKCLKCFLTSRWFWITFWLHLWHQILHFEKVKEEPDEASQEREAGDPEEKSAKVAVC